MHASWWRTASLALAGILFSSRLLEYEVWVRLNARDLHRSHANVASALINRVTFVELKPEVLERVLEPFPVPVRTLDALHLASIAFLLRRDQTLELLAAAQALGVPLTAL